MKTLIVEDDFTSRLLMQAILSPYGECHIAVNGREAVQAFRLARGRSSLRPRLPGHHDAGDGRPRGAQSAPRRRRGGRVLIGDGAKVVMTTALRDTGNVFNAFREMCDGYLTKPVDKAKLLGLLASLAIIA